MKHTPSESRRFTLLLYFSRVGSCSESSDLASVEQERARLASSLLTGHTHTVTHPRTHVRRQTAVLSYRVTCRSRETSSVQLRQLQNDCGLTSDDMPVTRERETRHCNGTSDAPTSNPCATVVAHASCNTCIRTSPGANEHVVSTAVVALWGAGLPLSVAASKQRLNSSDASGCRSQRSDL